MAQFRILSGVSTALPAVSAQTEGTVFYTHDNSLFHIDYKDANGNFVRKTLNAEQAKKLMEARTITLSGDVSGSVSFDGSQNVVIETKVADTFASKDDVNSLDILLSANIDKKADKSYVDEELSKIEINFMTVSYENMITVASPGQTIFSTGIETFDPENDTLEVHQGRLYLTRGEDYTISGFSVVLNEAPEVGETLTFSVLKNVPALEGEITITPSMLEDGSIPLSKLEEMPVTATPDWNVNDENDPAYIKNRTHWSEITETTSNVLTWDGNTEGLESVGFDGIALYRVSDVVLETSDLVNGTMTVRIDGVEEQSAQIPSSIIQDAGDFIVVADACIVVKKDNAEINGLVFPKAGIYYMDLSLNGVFISKLELAPGSTKTFTITSEIVHKLDKKYLPEISSIKNVLDGNARGSVRTIGAFYEIGEYAFAEGLETTASGDYSHAEGYKTIATGSSSHAEGYDTKAYDHHAHAEGRETMASGWCSHAEGGYTTASSYYSHAEGERVTASGEYSHAEGGWTTASGQGSHAEGYYTTASSNYQHAQGKYNIEDSSDVYAHIVGNGTSSTLSNAHTLDWDGNAWFSGDVYTGSTSGTNKDAGSKKLATEQFVTSSIAAIPTPDVSGQIAAHNSAVDAHADIRITLSGHTTNTDIHFTSAERNKLANIAPEANKYIHPTSGVSAGTYKSVTVDANGHVTSGTNPTTLAGYGITDAESKGAVNTHNNATDAHNDIRLLIDGVSTKLNNFLNVTDTTKDQLSEIIALIEANKTDIESITSGKVNVSDIINNLTTNVSNKPLSAAQGVVLKGLIDTLQTAVNGNTGSINTINGEITTLQNRVSAAEGKITGDIQNQLDAKANKTELPTKVGDLVNDANYVSQSYVDTLVGGVQSSFNTVMYENLVTATTEGQKVFDIGIGSYDSAKDALNVHDGRLYLTRNHDYTVSGQTVTLVEGVNVGDTLTFTVLKNIPVLDEEITISPSLLENGSIPLSKLQAMPTAAQVGAYSKAEVDALIAQAVNAAKAEIMASLTVTSDVPMVFGITDDGGLSVTYDDEAVN